jgi:hypothetical protein
MKNIRIIFFSIIIFGFISCNQNNSDSYELYVSCLNSDVETVENLLSTGISPDSEIDEKEYKKFSGLYIENRKISFDNSSKRKEYIDDFTTTPLTIAAVIGNTDLVKLLLGHEANINKTSGRFQRTPLIVSILNDNTDVTSLLLENGADVNIADNEGRIALHASIYKHYDEISDALIPLVNNIDTEDNDGYTPLAFAFSTGKGDENIPIILKLLVAGANINKITDTDDSPEVKELVNKILISFNEIMYPDITVYFPAKPNYGWEYLGNNGKITDVVICKEATDAGALFYTYITYLGMRTGDMYIFESNTVQQIVSINAFGRQQFYRPALTILTTPGKQWKEGDGGDMILCHSKKTSVSFDGRTYEDCIMIEKEIYVGENEFLMTRRQYFARDIGLVYVTLQGVDDNVEKPFLRLSSHNF